MESETFHLLSRFVSNGSAQRQQTGKGWRLRRQPEPALPCTSGDTLTRVLRLMRTMSSSRASMRPAYRLENSTSKRLSSTWI